MSQPKSRACPKCGSFLFENDEVCPTCGTEVKDKVVDLASQSQLFQLHKHWIFFIMGFIFGLFAAEEFFRYDDVVVWGSTEGSSYVFPILLAAISVISIGLGVFFLIRYKKRISGFFSKRKNDDS